MAKRYHQSERDRMHESAGMKRRLGDGYYEGMEDRRRQEMEDAGMIHEDHSAIANMPQSVMIKPWPDGGMYTPEGLDDTIKGVNKQMNEDGAKMKKHLRPHKY